MIKRFYFIRHGESEMNVSRQFAGISDTPLTENGREQARLAGRKAKKLNIDYIISSPLSRAHETAKIIAKEIGFPENKIHVDPLFIERNFGAFEGKKWVEGTDLEAIEGVESIESILARAKVALEFLETINAENILVVSHGSFGRALRHHITDHRFESVASDTSRIPNAEIVCWI